MRFQIHYKYYLLQNIFNYLSNKNKHWSWNVLTIWWINPFINAQLHKINKAYL